MLQRLYWENASLYRYWLEIITPELRSLRRIVVFHLPPEAPTMDNPYWPNVSPADLISSLRKLMQADMHMQVMHARSLQGRGTA